MRQASDFVLALHAKGEGVATTSEPCTHARAIGVLLQRLVKAKDHEGVIAMYTTLYGSPGGRPPVQLPISNTGLQAVLNAITHIGCDEDGTGKDFCKGVWERHVKGHRPSQGAFAAFLRACLALDSRDPQVPSFHARHSATTHAMRWARHHDYDVDNQAAVALLGHCGSQDEILYTLEAHSGFLNRRVRKEERLDWNRLSQRKSFSGKVLRYTSALTINGAILASLARACFRSNKSRVAFAILQIPEQTPHYGEPPKRFPQLSPEHVRLRALRGTDFNPVAAMPRRNQAQGRPGEEIRHFQNPMKLRMVPNLPEDTAMRHCEHTFESPEPFNALLHCCAHTRSPWAIYNALHVVRDAFHAPSLRATQAALTALSSAEYSASKSFDDLVDVYFACFSHQAHRDRVAMERERLQERKEEAAMRRLDGIGTTLNEQRGIVDDRQPMLHRDYRRMRVESVWLLWNYHMRPYATDAWIRRLIHCLDRAGAPDAFLEECIVSLLKEEDVHGDAVDVLYSLDGLASCVLSALMHESVQRKDLGIKMLKMFTERNAAISTQAMVQVTKAFDSRDRVLGHGNIESLMTSACKGGALTESFEESLVDSVQSAFCTRDSVSPPGDGGMQSNTEREEQARALTEYVRQAVREVRETDSKAFSNHLEEIFPKN